MRDAHLFQGQLLTRRLVRAGLIVLAGWLLLEIALFQLVAARVGWGMTLGFISIKGGIGLLLIGFLAWRGLTRLKSLALKPLAKVIPGEARFQALFGIASGILITLPGFLPSLVGVALFSPSLRRVLLARFSGSAAKPTPKDFDLDSGEWHEIRRKKRATRARLRKASLEARPPSV